MLNIYSILRISSLIKSKRIKLFGVWLFHVIGRRYIGVFLDPVLACNFRCRMCYFSDEECRKNFRGSFDYEEIEQIAKSLFHRALKCQIGCGAEPTLHNDLTKIVLLGKKFKVPYIALTTNGYLLDKEKLIELVEVGLNELTLSCHGLTRHTYEYFMVNGSFDHFCLLLKEISEIKRQYPDFRLRINFTVNNLNVKELNQIWNVTGDAVDILQIRPVQEIGNTDYSDFDLSTIYENYDSIFIPLTMECRKRNITFLMPGKENIIALKDRESDNAEFEEATYCYISPKNCWKDDFDYRTDNFESYSKRMKLAHTLFRNIFFRNKRKEIDLVRKMNYNVVTNP